MKALTEAGSLGGSKLNLKGTGWETDGGEVASGTDCTVISGTRLTPSKSFASVLASSVRLGLACCGETTPVVVSGARITPDMSPAGCQRRRLARQPTRCCLLPGHGCPTFSSCSEEGGGTNPDAALPPRGENVVEFAAAGRADGRRCRCRAAGKEYHVGAAVEGHELEAPEAEQRPGLKRLLETTHLELNGKLFVNTQQAPTWRANCRRFDPGGVPGPMSKIVAACPSPDGLVRDGTQRGENRGSCYPAQGGCTCSRGYKRSRGRERESRFVSPSSRATTLPHEGPGPSFYRCKEKVQVYNGGVDMC
jgi:hypothetical protein